MGKQTIYRWWKNKSALVGDCLVAGMLLPQDLTLSDTGDIRSDIAEWLDRIFATLGAPGGEGLLRSLIAAAAANPDIARLIRDSLSGEHSVTGRLQAATGQAPGLYPGAPLDAIAEGLVGTVLLRVLGGETMTQDETRRAADAALGIR